MYEQVTHVIPLSQTVVEVGSYLASCVLDAERDGDAKSSDYVIGGDPECSCGAAALSLSFSSLFSHTHSVSLPLTSYTAHSFTRTAKSDNLFC